MLLEIHGAFGGVAEIGCAVYAVICGVGTCPEPAGALAEVFVGVAIAVIIQPVTDLCRRRAIRVEIQITFYPDLD